MGFGIREASTVSYAPTYDLAKARAALPALEDVTYLNSGTEGIMAEPVIDAYLETLRRFERYGHYARTQLVPEMDKARARFARLVNSDPDEIAVTRNGTDGVSIVMGAFSFSPGDELIIGGEEHPALTYPAFALQTFSGVRVRRFEFHHDPTQTLASFEAAITPRTRLAAFSHVSCETGIRNPAREIIALAHSRGFPVLLDGAQSVGSLDVDFQEIGADFLTGSAHKWLCGPKGTGVLIVRKDRLNELTPRYIGGGSLADFPWSQLSNHESIRVEFHPSASRFEYGMRNPAVYAGLTHAIDYLEALGWDAIRDHERHMATVLKQRLASIPGLKVQTPMDWAASSAIVNVAVEGVSGADVSKRLWDDFKIVQRAVREPNGVRISCNYFVNESDLDRLADALIVIRG
jgi:selenocysteine lyase/cysteine desulfurase